MGVKYDLKASKEVIGPLYPRLLDKQGREIDGFHREEADSEWPKTQLEHIDTDVKYWTARIVANTHRRSVSKEERKKDFIELAKALRAEGQEGSLVKTIHQLTTFSESYIRNLLSGKLVVNGIEIDLDEFKRDYTEPDKSLLSSDIKQKPKRKPREQTTDKEKLKNLYKKVKKSAVTGQGNTSQKIEGAKELGLDVEQYEENLGKIKEILKDSLGRRYEDVKDLLNEAYNSSVEMKKTLTRQIKAEKARVKKANEELKKEVLRDREFLEQAEKTLKKKRSEELKARNLEEKKVKRPQINILNELTGGEWLKFTKSWYVFDALGSDLAEEKTITAGLSAEHPATFSPTMISEYVRFFTKRNALVLDPFVGIGSTLVACSRTGRKGIGIEIIETYVDIAMKRIEGNPNQKVIHGDAWDLEKYDLPKIDYCVTSPPYLRMLEKIDVTQKRRIRKGLATNYGDSVSLPDPEEVDKYVNALVDLFSKIADITNEKGYLTVIIRNFRDKGRMIPLAWQFTIAMQEKGDWVFKGEKLWCQDHKKLHPFGQKFEFVSNIHHHYCLIFRRN